MIWVYSGLLRSTSFWQHGLKSSLYITVTSLWRFSVSVCVAAIHKIVLVVIDVGDGGKVFCCLTSGSHVRVHSPLNVAAPPASES